MAGLVHPTVPLTITRRRLVTGSIGVFAGAAAINRLSAQDPSPEAGAVTGGPERLVSLLEVVPGSFAEQAIGAGVSFYYADVKTQLDAVGIPAYEAGSEDLPTGYMDAISVLALAAQAFTYALEPDFATTFGFSPLQVEEVLTVGSPPNEVTIFRGGMTVEDLPAAWEASGFARETSADGTEIWTAGREGELDLTSNVGLFGAGSLNNAAIFGDTVVFGRYFADLETIAAHMADPGETFIDAAALGDLLGSLSEDIVSVVAVHGSFLDLHTLMLPDAAEALQAEIEAAAAETGPFPEIRQALFGITAGAMGPSFEPTGEGTPAATPAGEVVEGEGGIIEVRLETASEEEAAAAVAGVNERWNSWTSLVTAEPYSELMTIVAAQPDPETPSIAAIDFRAIRSNRIWIDLVLQRDLSAFAWAGEAPVEATPTAAG